MLLSAVIVIVRCDMNALETEMIEQHGNKHRVEYFAEHDCEAPWDNMDTMGTVSDWETRDKSPGELVLTESHGSKRFYDFQEAVKKARSSGLSGERAVEVARSEYRYLRRWCDSEWYYIGIQVTFDDYSASLWGIESDADSYHSTVIQDLIEEIEHDINRNCKPVASFGV